MAWRVAESLKTLKAQIDTAFPRRSRVSDGSIGDRAHRSRKSDHNPNSNGVVTAIDVTHDPLSGVNCNELADALVESRDPRIKYLIWNGRITQKGLVGWKTYKGSNPHNHHLHISVASDRKLYDDAREWKVNLADEADALPALQLTDPMTTGDMVKTAQTRLKAHGAVISVDGKFGYGTENAVRAFQSKNGLKDDGVIGAKTWRLLLDKA